MPRKSAASQSIIGPSSSSTRLKPPATLSKAERDVFADLVSSNDAKHFRPSDMALLVAYSEAAALQASTAPQVIASPPTQADPALADIRVRRALNLVYDREAVAGKVMKLGEIPAYYLMDLTANYKIGKFDFGLSINNLTDNRYFTRRALGFPGPGIIPADARSVFFMVGFKL